jgi:hypothetical protein
MDNKKLVGGIFCDLQKAFDSVNHEILINKIQLYGIRGKMGKLIQSFITDKYQKVTCNDHFSAWKKIQVGVPLCSVLGPLLFLICCCGLMADLGFIPLVFWHPSTALIVLEKFDPVLGTGGDELCPLLYFFVCILSSGYN